MEHSKAEVLYLVNVWSTLFLPPKLQKLPRCSRRAT